MCIFVSGLVVTKEHTQELLIFKQCPMKMTAWWLWSDIFSYALLTVAVPINNQATFNISKLNTVVHKIAKVKASAVKVDCAHVLQSHNIHLEARRNFLGGKIHCWHSFLGKIWLWK